MKETIWYQFGKEGMRETKAEIFGGVLGVHRVVNGSNGTGWIITHLPTGLRIGHPTRLGKQSRSVAEELVRVFGADFWAEITSTEDLSPSVVESIKEATEYPADAYSPLKLGTPKEES